MATNPNFSLNKDATLRDVSTTDLQVANNAAIGGSAGVVGDMAVDGGDLVSNAAAFRLLVNNNLVVGGGVAGAGPAAIAIGDAAATTTLAGNLVVNGTIAPSVLPVVRSGGIGVIPDGATPTITAALMLGPAILNYVAGTNVTGALWDTGANLDTALTAASIVLSVGLSFDVTINNSDATVFIFGAVAAGLTSGSGAATDAAGQIPVAAAGLAPSATFRFVRTGANAYTFFCLGMAAS
jgi:hypothetical protein